MPRGDGYFRKKGQVIYWEFMHRGKRYSIRLGKITKSEARNIVAKIKTKIISGEWEEEKERDILMIELFNAYQKWYESHSRARKRSKEAHIYRIRLLKDFFGGLRAGEVSWWTIENYKSKRLKSGVSKVTINKELKILKSVFNRAKALGLYNGEIPKIEAFKEGGEERVRYISPEEAQRLVDACPEWFKPVVIFALNTGLRAGEIFSLTWENVDFDNKVIRIESESTKTKEVYTIPMNENVMSLLRRVKERQEAENINHGYVFTNSKGLPYKYEDRTYRRVFITACKKAGIKDFRFHDLRHTFASWVAMNSKDIYAVQHLLHHKDLRMTKRYAHLTEEYLQEIVESIQNFASFSEDDKEESA